MRAIRPRVCSVHIQSLNHNPRSGETFFQTDSNITVAYSAIYELAALTLGELFARVTMR
jgi:hypothetical protein